MNDQRWQAADVDGPNGYALGLALRPDELGEIQSHIVAQWLERLRDRAPQYVDRFAELGLARYHRAAHLVDHGSLWPKSTRILPPQAVAAIRGMSIFRELESAFGRFAISDEEQVGWEEITWRLVRPGQPSDVGPLHADAWFWELGHGRTPAGVRRVKVWIAVVSQPGLSGLRVVAGSHLRQWRYHGEHRHGMIKPQIDEDERALNPQLLPLDPGEGVVFHDGLLHGGAVNAGWLTRVSVEFTMFVKH